MPIVCCTHLQMWPEGFPREDRADFMNRVLKAIGYPARRGVRGSLEVAPSLAVHDQIGIDQEKAVATVG
jgi:hypothetical protein